MHARPLFLLAIAALAALAAIAVVRPADAHVPHPGLDFSMAVRGVSGCDTIGGDASCTIPAGEVFVVEVSLNSFEGIANYDGYDIFIGIEGLTAMEDVDMSVWPDCGFAAMDYQPQLAAFACALDVPPAPSSTYTGVIAVNSFTCTASGRLQLLHGDGNTDLVSNTTEVHTEVADGSEDLNITCEGAPPPPDGDGDGDGNGAGAQTPADGATVAPEDATTTAVARTTAEAAETPDGDGEATDDDDDGGFPGWAWAIIGVAFVGGAGLAGYAGWQYYRSRQATPPAE